MKNPEKFGWRPKQLLPQLASIYLHLERADSKGAFAAAIALSDRYRQDMFPETCQVLCWLVFATSQTTSHALALEFSTGKSRHALLSLTATAKTCSQKPARWFVGS